LRESPRASRKVSSLEAEEESVKPQEREEVPGRQIFLRAHEDIEPEKRERIEELGEKVDRARSRLDRREETESPRLTLRDLLKVGD